MRAVEASFTIFCSAVTSASTSAFVLYIANDARVVAATFICAMTGMQQWWPVRTAMPSRSSRVPRSIAEMAGFSTTSEITLPLFRAVPMMRKPGTWPSCSVA